MFRSRPADPRLLLLRSSPLLALGLTGLARLSQLTHTHTLLRHELTRKEVAAVFPTFARCEVKPAPALPEWRSASDREETLEELKALDLTMFSDEAFDDDLALSSYQSCSSISTTDCSGVAWSDSLLTANSDVRSEGNSIDDICPVDLLECEPREDPVLISAPVDDHDFTLMPLRCSPETFLVSPMLNDLFAQQPRERIKLRMRQSVHEKRMQHPSCGAIFVCMYHSGVCDASDDWNDGMASALDDQLAFLAGPWMSSPTPSPRRRRRRSSFGSDGSPAADALLESPTPSVHQQAATRFPHIDLAEVPWFDMIYNAQDEDAVTDEAGDHDSLFTPDETGNFVGFDGCDLDNTSDAVGQQLAETVVRCWPLDLAVDMDRFIVAHDAVLSGVDFVDDDTSTLCPSTPRPLKLKELSSDVASPPAVLKVLDHWYDDADTVLLDFNLEKRVPTALHHGPDN